MVDSFLGNAEQVQAVVSEAESLYQADGVMRPAAMSQGKDKWNESAVRGM